MFQRVQGRLNVEKLYPLRGFQNLNTLSWKEKKKKKLDAKDKETKWGQTSKITVVCH